MPTVTMMYFGPKASPIKNLLKGDVGWAFMNTRRQARVAMVRRVEKKTFANDRLEYLGDDDVALDVEA